MGSSRRETLEFLMLGRSPKGAEGWPHPASISVHPRGAATLINVSMGPHIANVGGQLQLWRVIVDGEFNETFAEEFDACDARWLVPYLVRLAADEQVTADELIDAYRSRFGRYPRTERTPDYTD